MRSTVQLRVIRDEPEPGRGERQVAPAARAAPDHGDLALLALLFLVNLVPVAGELTGLGRWSPSVVGFAACAVLLTGRELWSQLRARARAKTAGEGTP